MMPELPEVETVVRGLQAHVEDSTIINVIVRYPTLRWPIPSTLKETLTHQKITKLSRRGKYLLFQATRGTLIIHLGMSGSIRLLQKEVQPSKHDHVDIVLSNQTLLRYNDPRRFGAILWTNDNPLSHPLLSSIGVEPLSSGFTGDYLQHRALKRQQPIKIFIMNSKIVAGIGNIYATEALFLAKVHPNMPACLLTKQQCYQLVESIQSVLAQAIIQGGTTLKDFVNSEGKPGYFSQKLNVYGRAGLPCFVCASSLQSMQLGQRSTVFCSQCQKH